MPRPTREHARTHMAQDIKAVARQLMQEAGTAGLTLRGIARMMDVTAPAIYHYYPRLDDLITALIVDAYTAVSEAIEGAMAAEVPASPVAQIMAGMLAYRDWALAHSIEFQLIYGNPIPGYHAPEEMTDALAQRPFLSIGRLMMELYSQGQLVLPPIYAEMPPTIAAHMAQWRALTGFPVPDVVLYAFVVGWTRIHGIVMLELFDHIQPSIGDTTAFYRHEVVAFLTSLGLTP